jgi:hypothetical protein
VFGRPATNNLAWPLCHIPSHWQEKVSFRVILPATSHPELYDQRRGRKWLHYACNTWPVSVSGRPWSPCHWRLPRHIQLSACAYHFLDIVYVDWSLWHTDDVKFLKAAVRHQLGQQDLPVQCGYKAEPVGYKSNWIRWLEHLTAWKKVQQRMNECMCIYIYVRMCVCMCIYVCTCMCVCMWIYVCTYVCIYVRMYACVNVCIYVYTCTYVCVYVCVCRRVKEQWTKVFFLWNVLREKTPNYLSPYQTANTQNTPLLTFFCEPAVRFCESPRCSRTTFLQQD